MLDPVLNPVWVALLVGEVPGVLSLIGAAIVIGGMIVNAFLSSEDNMQNSA
jgi:drug/metabolite transporter (DMT)-like permease